MSIDLTVTSARQGDASLRHQRARIEQRHLQFGGHCRLDTGSLLFRVVHRVREPLTEVAVQRNDVPTDPVQHSTLETVNRWMAPEAYDAAHALEATSL